jgi:hypothetical protein
VSGGSFMQPIRWLQLMPHYLVSSSGLIAGGLPKPYNYGEMSGRKITCKRLDYWSRGCIR